VTVAEEGLMDTAPFVAALEREWELDDGFFGQLRQGRFDIERLNRLIRVLDAIDLEDDFTVDRRLVSLLWYVPPFMEWQKERIGEAGGDLVEFEKAINQVLTSIERILGIP
jgi:hypothetical protein